MRDWKAAARGWVARDNEREAQTVRTNPASHHGNERADYMKDYEFPDIRELLKED